MKKQSVDVDLDDGESITVVFKNVKLDSTEGEDHGDAPIGYPDASHELGGPWLGGQGDNPDAETGQQSHAQAKGDDMDGNDDEDGISQAKFVRNQGGLVNTTFTSGPSGDLSAKLWVDFNMDGDWIDPGETIQVVTIVNMAPNTQINFSFSCPGIYITKTGTTYLRARIIEGGFKNLNPSGNRSLAA